METLEQDRVIHDTCEACKVNRPEEAHLDGCPHADDTIKGDRVAPEGTEGGGGWVLKIEPEHVCIKPTIDNRTFVGSIWQCGGCGQHWLVYERRGQYAGQKGLKRITPEGVQERLAKRAK